MREARELGQLFSMKIVDTTRPHKKELGQLFSRYALSPRKDGPEKGRVTFKYKHKKKH